MSKFEVGDRVIPVSKSIGYGLNHADGEWAIAKTMNQPFLIVRGIYTPRVQCSAIADSRLGEFFLESDLVPFEDAIKHKQVVKAGRLDKSYRVQNPNRCLTCVHSEYIHWDAEWACNRTRKEDKYKSVDEHYGICDKYEPAK